MIEIELDRGGPSRGQAFIYRRLRAFSTKSKLL
jgi:hypothetical protein